MHASFAHRSHRSGTAYLFPCITFFIGTVRFIVDIVIHKVVQVVQVLRLQEVAYILEVIK